MWLETKVCSDKEDIRESSAAMTVAAAIFASLVACSPDRTFEGPEIIMIENVLLNSTLKNISF